MKMSNSSYIVKENIEYADVNTATHYIEIDSGPLQGTCFTFGTVEFTGEDAEGNGIINFDYNLIHLPETIILQERREEIEGNIGKILQTIMEQQVEDKRNISTENVNETGDPDTEQPSE
jgi:hypothetical protein